MTLHWKRVRGLSSWLLILLAQAGLWHLILVGWELPEEAFESVVLFPAVFRRLFSPSVGAAELALRAGLLAAATPRATTSENAMASRALRLIEPATT